jgi:amino acid adenylation domain-containing protein
MSGLFQQAGLAPQAAQDPAPQQAAALVGSPTPGADPGTHENAPAASATQRLTALLSDLRRLDVKLWVDGDRLRVNAPAGTLSPDLQRELSRHKPDIVALLGRSRRSAASAPAALVRAPRDGRLPLSFSQQRLWFLSQIDPDSPAYNISTILRLRGALSVSALGRSLEELVRRHETLRTRIVVHDGEASQVVEPAGPFQLDQHDLRGMPSAERLTRAAELSREEGLRPFDLQRAPLLRGVLYCLDHDDHVLALTVHHIAADGWSNAILGRELSVLYEAFSHGRPSPLPEPQLQFIDYAAWQRRWLLDERVNTQIDYWKRQLAGPLPALDLTSDRPRPPTRSGRGTRQVFELDRRLVDGLTVLSRRQGATLFMTLLAAFQTLLSRMTGQEDLLVGTPVAGRGRVELEGLVGFFINTLVLRTDLSGDPTFSELLGRVRAVALDAYANQDVPFERLVEIVQPERDATRPPLVQVLFSLQNFASEDLTLGDLKIEPVVTESATSRFDLTFELYEQPDGLAVWVEYNTDLYDTATIERLLGQYRTLLEGIVAAPDARISELPLLTDAERRQVLREWNRTEADYPREAGIHRLVETQAARVPDAVAVAFDEHTIGYGQLNARANQLARDLRQRGVGPGTIVGVYLERSIEMVVALLGIMKAGGAYLPLDPLFPPDRLSYMLADSQAGVLLTQQRLSGTLLPPGGEVVCLDADWPIIASQDTTDLPEPSDPEALAYVLYTSGSTGRPKGVQIAHRSVVNFLSSMRRAPGLTPDDVLLSVTTLSFDIAGLELFLPLTTGARVVLVRAAVAADGDALLRALTTSGATVMQATPATWRLLLAAGWQGTPGLKALCGGEALPGELAAGLLARCDSLWNMYGPTETTIWSTIHEVEAPGALIPIGRPIANTQVYVLDKRLQPVPIGAPGELYIGGDGLALGYLNRPELTAEKFVDNPFADAAPERQGGRRSARLYRTGDLVRYRPDGTLEYLQRIDQQVKIRGYRIEPGEIEAVLAQHPSVHQAVVVARADGSGEQRLVAYVVPSHAAAADVEAWRDHLKARLPAYMVPAATVVLDAIPLTPNGKVDRKGLPEPAQSAERRTVSAAPQTETERRLAAIWQEILGLERVGVEDNFFDLGGHSLLLLRVHSRVRQAFETSLTVAEMFQHSTIAALARHIESPRAHAPRVDNAQQRGGRLRDVLGRRRSA